MNNRIAQLLAAAALTAVFGWQEALANPNSDPLAGIIQQRQKTAPAAEPDRDGLDKLIREKTANAAATAKPAAKPAAKPTNEAARTAAADKTDKDKAEKAEKTDAKPAGRSDADDIIASAMGFLGVAYRFGGTSPTGFDCSGFMQYIFRRTYAVNLPRTSAEQATVGTPVSRGELQPGDMVFFRTAGRRISHVGMYVGNNRFIHAPRTGKRIEITSLSNKYWNSKYATARRVKRQNAQNFIRK